MRIPAVPSWPGLAASVVLIGGVSCTVEQACTAAGVLAASKSSAIRSLLAAAGSPLAECDYWAVARPFLAAARSALSPTGQRGCAGRHVAKTAFCEALCHAVELALKAAWKTAMDAIGRDERYAASMAAAAMDVRRRRYARESRARLLQAADSAMALCRAAAGQFACDNVAMCGTGTCVFADPAFAFIPGPAPEGRFTRPPNHTAGGTFCETRALESWLERHPYKARYPVRDSDGCQASDLVAA